MRTALIAAVATALFSTAAAAAEADPLNSVMWESVREVLFADAPVVFDERVRVFTPAVVEDNMNVPVSVRVTGLDDVREVALFADHNPVPLALIFVPTAAAPYFETRIKVQEATPIRAAARTGDGVWHVGGMRADAAGGGCTAPSVTRSTGNWDLLNRVDGEAWRRGDGGVRLRFRVVHPMDTGLVDSIPAFFIEELVVRAPDGRELARFATYEPVAENPVLSIDVLGHDGDFLIGGRDNNGNEIAARIASADAAFGLRSAGR